ncbi:hypothetical protein MUB04_15055 [Acinetobacter indicus]|uniref:hypothetical protein n=1 Tax=Acinetobacter TaxID=469 RepID=UPI0015D3C6F1|nr:MULTISPECIES: hypothetical protein [Acinetobacter]MCP0917853.1 hypothetical protein [Acinetobacter indicus]
MNETLSIRLYDFANGNRVKFTISLCALLTAIVLSCTGMSRSDIAYKSYWIEIKNADLDKPAMVSHIAVLRYHLRKVNAEDLEDELNNQQYITNRQLISFLDQVADIYNEYQIARHPRRGVLNPS